MNKKIIWRSEDGGVQIFEPSPEALEKHTTEVIAKVVAPSGAKYAIVDTSTIPTDRTFRGAWEVDESELTDGVGA